MINTINQLLFNPSNYVTAASGAGKGGTGVQPGPTTPSVAPPPGNPANPTTIQAGIPASQQAPPDYGDPGDFAGGSGGGGQAESGTPPMTGAPGKNYTGIFLLALLAGGIYVIVKE